MGVCRAIAWGLAPLLSLGVVGGAAYAQDPKFEYGKKEEVKEAEWKASAQVGLLFATGNSRSLTISLGAAASYKASDNKLSLETTGALARTDLLVANDADGDGDIGPGEFSRQSSDAAKNFVGKLRYDRFLTDRDALYVTARVGFDELAGKKIFAGGQVGYSRILYKDDEGKHVVTGEIGYDFSYEAYEAASADSITIHSARLFFGYAGKLNDNTGLAASVEGLANINKETVPQGEASAFEDLRGIVKAELTTKIVEKISLRVAMKVLYDNVPAPLPPFAIPFEAGFVPLADKVDFVTELALIVNFL